MKEIRKYCDLPMERMVNQTLWHSIMGEIEDKNQFENDTFAVKAYNWADGEEGINDWHFWHKPSGFKMAWYKYPLRGVCSNMEITHEEFYAVLQDSMNSIRKSWRDATFTPWWEKENFVDSKIKFKKMKQDIFEFCEDNEIEDTLLFENPGYETAFLGLDEKGRAVYNYNKMVEFLMEEDDMSYEEAVEFIEYNTIRACDYIENAPLILLNEYEYIPE